MERLAKEPAIGRAQEAASVGFLLGHSHCYTIWYGGAGVEGDVVFFSSK
jgi:hypothetical protein